MHGVVGEADQVRQTRESVNSDSAVHGGVGEAALVLRMKQSVKQIRCSTRRRWGGGPGAADEGVGGLR